MALQERLTLRNLYLYLVCLITLVISVFAIVNITRNTVALLYPDPGYYGYYGPVHAGPGHPEEALEGDRGITEEEQRRQEELARDSERRHTVLELVGSGTTLLVAGPLYVYHWRRVQSELASQPRATSGPDAPGTP